MDAVSSSLIPGDGASRPREQATNMGFSDETQVGSVPPMIPAMGSRLCHRCYRYGTQLSVT